MKRRNLSGIYIFDTLEGDEKRKPTCIEDCKKETLDEWLETLSKEALIRTVSHLCNTISELGNAFDIINE